MHEHGSHEHPSLVKEPTMGYAILAREIEPQC
jgi:hypothetical protein